MSNSYLLNTSGWAAEESDDDSIESLSEAQHEPPVEDSADITTNLQSKDEQFTAKKRRKKPRPRKTVNILTVLQEDDRDSRRSNNLTAKKSSLSDNRQRNSKYTTSSRKSDRSRKSNDRSRKSDSSRNRKSDEEEWIIPKLPQSTGGVIKRGEWKVRSKRVNVVNE